VGETRGDPARHTAALLFYVGMNRVMLLGKHELLRKYLVHTGNDISTQLSLKSGNASCLSVQNLLSSSLLSKNIKIKVY
jgi:hypothetical protein